MLRVPNFYKAMSLCWVNRPLGGVEAGCQGTMRLEVTLGGARAHTARPWMGRNAIHRLGEILDVVSNFEGRRPVVEGCEYRESLQSRVCGGRCGWQRRAGSGDVAGQLSLCSGP